MTRGRNEIDQLPTPMLMPQWMHCQQTPQNYVEFLAESGYSEVQKEISYNISAQVSGLGLADLSHMDWIVNCGNAFQAYTAPDASVSKHPPKANQKRSREKAYAADRSSKKALVDDVIDQIKYLQHQVKDLSQNRLGGESTSNSFIFLEGHGHYFVREQMLDGPLEEMLGKLLEFNPSSATELLQIGGLIVMPMTFIEGLREPAEILNIQEKGSL